MFGGTTATRPLGELVALGLLVFALGCNEQASKLEGHWKGQEADGVAESATAQANAFATATQIVARDGHIAIETPAGRHGPAKYRVEKEDETTVVIRTDPGVLAETFTFDGAGKMVWKLDAERSIAFKRASSP